MRQTVTAKIRINVDPSDHDALQQAMKTYTSACDYVSGHVFSTHVLNKVKLHNDLYYLIRDQFGLSAQLAESVIRTVIARYKTILENQKEWIRPKFKKPQMDLVRGRDYTLFPDKDTVSVKTLTGRIRAPYWNKGMEHYFSDQCSFGTAKLVYKKNKFYLHIPVTYDIEELPLSEVTNVVGVDRGIRFVAVTYDSEGKTVFYSGNKIKQKRAHYKKIRQQLQKKGTASSRRRLKAIGHKENRWMNDVNHCISKALCESNPEGTLFVLEDLTGVRAATERVRTVDRYVTVSWSYYDLEQKLQYKALRNHQRIMKVSPAYTSQKCPICEHTAKSNRDKRNHHFRCQKCGYRSNDDRIAAMNLQRMGSLVPVAVAVE